jgi:hypothetical protein
MLLHDKAAFSGWIQKNAPGQKAEGDHIGLLVAGTGFEPVTFRL